MLVILHELARLCSVLAAEHLVFLWCLSSLNLRNDTPDVLIQRQMAQNSLVRRDTTLVDLTTCAIESMAKIDLEGLLSTRERNLNYIVIKAFECLIIDLAINFEKIQIKYLEIDVKNFTYFLGSKTTFVSSARGLIL